MVYRVIIRRKNTPLLSMTFETEKDAKKWVEDHEEKYIIDPTFYIENYKSERLIQRRKREFNRKKI